MDLRIDTQLFAKQVARWMHVHPLWEIMARQNDSDARSNFADTDHTSHRNRHVTVFLKHLRTSESPAIPTSIVRRNSSVSVNVLFEHLKRKKLEEPDGVFLPVFEEACTRNTRLRWGAGENRANIAPSMSGLVGVWPAHLLDFCHPVLRINAGDSLLLSKSVALLDLISEDWSSILQPQCVS